MIECPECGSRDLRYSRTIRGLAERLQTWVGVRPLRCRDCWTRFVGRTWSLSSLKYARCPRCWRMDLNLWSSKDHHGARLQRFLLAFGARPYRCEYCRCNFVSFRMRKEKFSFRRWARRVRANAENGAAAD